jgi:hypothetical protein
MTRFNEVAAQMLRRVRKASSAANISTGFNEVEQPCRAGTTMAVNYPVSMRSQQISCEERHERPARKFSVSGFNEVAADKAAKNPEGRGRGDAVRQTSMRSQ